MKTLIQDMDRTIKRRRLLYTSKNKEELEEINNFKSKYSKFAFLKYAALGIYVLLPFMEKPAWCLTSSEIDRDTKEGYWYCQNKLETIANSNIPKLPAWATNSIYILCLMVIFWFIKARDVYRARDPYDRVPLTLWLIAIAVADLMLTLVVDAIAFSQDSFDNNWLIRMAIYPYINAFIRPVIFTLTVRSVKSFWRRYVAVIVSSLPMAIFIFVYVFYFAWMGQRLFAGTIEGVENFSNFSDSFFYMFVLITTSNYPDVMLPSYAQARHNSIFFIVYLVVGLFLLFNLLLAIFYSNYQERVEASIDKYKEQRNAYLIYLYRKNDKDNNEAIDKDGVFELIKEIHSLVNGSDKKLDEIDMTPLQFDQIFKIMDKDGSGDMGPMEMVDLLLAYETWLYEK